MPASISVAIITRNEETNIRRCLESIRWTDEVVVVDSGSTDGTAEICREYGCRFIEHDWEGYGRQKNYALTQASSDWVLSLDADEEVTSPLAEEIRGILITPDAHSAYTVPRENMFLGRKMRHGGWYPDRQVRLIRRGIGRFKDVALHECIVFPEDKMVTVGSLQNPLIHYTYPTIADFVAKANSYSSIEADAMVKEGRVPKSLIFSMVTAFPRKFVEVYLYKGGWRDGLHGFIAATLMSARVFLRYATLWDATHQPDVRGHGRVPHP